MANRTTVVGSDYKLGDLTGPYKIATTSDIIVDGVGNSISSNVRTFATKTSDYPITASLDGVILVNAASNNITITLPTVSSGLYFTIKRIDSVEAKTVVITGSANIDGQSSIGLIPYSSINLLSNGSAWYII